MVNKEVFILGFTDRAGLAFARWFSTHGYSVAVLTSDLDEPSLSSRYISKVLAQTSLQRSVKQAVSDIESLIPSQSVVIPLNDAYLSLVLSTFDTWSTRYKLPYKSAKSVKSAIDKYALLEIAKNVGVSVPRTVCITKQTQLDNSYRIPFDFPVIIKPRVSAVIHNDQVVELSVKKVETKDDFLVYVSERLQFSDVLIQEYLPGHGYAVNLSSYHQTIYAYFEYKRLHEPSFGGGSSYRQSTEPTDALRQASESMMSALDFNGIAMLEFRKSKGQLYMMEINARPWGSILLPMFCGIDFPEHMVRIANDTAPKSQLQYAVGKRTRHIFKDLKWLVAKKRDIGSFLRMPADVLVNREAWDLVSLRDSRPAFRYVFQLAVKVRRALYLRLSSLPLFFQSVSSLTRRISARPVKTVMFVCRGNINRSVYAEHVLKDALSPLSKTINVVSSGTYPIKGRKASFMMHELANKQGMNLDEHRSACIFDELYDEPGSLIIAMDQKQYVAIKGAYSHALVINFGHLIKQSKVPDPYGHPKQAYKDCMRFIEQGMEVLVPCL